MNKIDELIYYLPEDLILWKNKTLLHHWKIEFPDLIQDHMLKEFDFSGKII